MLRQERFLGTNEKSEVSRILKDRQYNDQHKNDKETSKDRMLPDSTI